MPEANNNYNRILLFDGYCNLCNRWINYVIDHDPEARITFASLQSKTGRNLIENHKLNPEKTDSVVFLENGKAYERSEAVLRTVSHLKGMVRLLQVALIVPRFMRDFAYDRIAGNRYNWFGRRDRCRTPEPGIRGRFLE